MPGWPGMGWAPGRAPRLRKGELVGILKSSGSLPSPPAFRMEAATAATDEGGMEAGRGNCCWEFMCSRELSSLGRSDLRGAVGLARAANSLGDTLTPALANNLKN